MTCAGVILHQNIAPAFRSLKMVGELLLSGARQLDSSAVFSPGEFRDEFARWYPSVDWDGTISQIRVATKKRKVLLARSDDGARELSKRCSFP